MADKQIASRGGVPQTYRDNADGSYADEHSSQLRAWDPISLAWVKVAVDHTSGALSVTGSGGAGGGGAATIADGADVAQGTTSDVAWSSGSGTVISLLKKIASAGGSAVSVADGADVAQGTTTDLSSASSVIGLLKAIKASVTGTLTVGTHAVTGPLTDTQLRATAVPVSLASAPTTAVTGPVTDTQLRASAVPVSLASAPTTAVTGPVTDTQLRASAVPVSLATNTPDVTDRSGRLLGHVTVDSAPTTAVTGPVTDTQLRASAVPVSLATAPTTPVTGPLTDTQLRASAVPVTSTDNLSQVGGSAVTLGAKVSASSIPVVVASDQAAIPTYKVSGGQTTVMKTATLATSASTVDQVVLTYTVTTAKTFYLCYLVMYGRLTTPGATASVLGAISLETPSGTKVITIDDVNPTTSEVEFNPITFSEPIPIAAGVVVRVVVSPAAATAMTWRANFGGYEK